MLHKQRNLGKSDLKVSRICLGCMSFGEVQEGGHTWVLNQEQTDEIKKRFNISAFFKDNLRNPEIGLMLMIIGDNKNSQNKKRNALLNPDYKYIAVNSKFIGDKFVSYFTFSK